jgi:hypothetical protein
MPANKPQSTPEEIRESIGDISGLDVLGNQLLLGIYMKGAKIGSIFIPDKTQDEDKFQGKVGLVLKKGPSAFVSDANHTFSPEEEAIKEGDWVVYRVSDGFPIDINSVHCRLIEDQDLKLTVTDPAIVY